VNTLKIDKAFIDELSVNADSPIVKTIIDMGRNRNFKRNCRRGGVNGTLLCGRINVLSASAIYLASRFRPQNWRILWRIKQ